MESKEACELFCPECILFFHGQISKGCCYINLWLKQMRLNSLLVWDVITVCLEQTFIANQQNKHLQTLYSKTTDFSISITWEEKSSLSCKYWQWLGCLDYGRWLINLTVQAYQQESRNTKESNNLIKKKGYSFKISILLKGALAMLLNPWKCLQLVMVGLFCSPAFKPTTLLIKVFWRPMGQHVFSWVVKVAMC